MNLNDFVVLPNNKARSVKLNARNLQKLQMDTVTLANESKDMEEKLLQLKDNMSKEKEERGWTFGQRGSSNSKSVPNSCKRNNIIQKLSAGKMKIRVLKDESLTAPAQPQCQPSPTDVGPGSTRRSRLREMSGQCEAETAAVVTAGKHGQEKMVGVTEDDKKGMASPFLRGQYNEEESARSFQEALMQWRGEQSRAGQQTKTMDKLWIPAKSVYMSAMATQADLPLDSVAEGRRREKSEEKQAVKVEFTENSLNYMDRLLVKKLRRTQIESHHPSLGFDIDLKSLTTTDTKEETKCSLTAEEEDFRQYCASVFAVPDGRGRNELQMSTPESFLVIEVIDETCRYIGGVNAAEQKTDNNKEISAVQPISRKEQPLMAHAAHCIDEALKAHSSSLPPAEPSRQSVTPVHSKPTKKLHLPDCQISKPEQSVKGPEAGKQPQTITLPPPDLAVALPSKSKTSAYPATKIPGTSKKSVKTPASCSSEPIRSHHAHKSKANCGSPQFLSPISHSQSVIPKSSDSPSSADVSAVDGNMPAIPKEHLSPSSSASFSLRSTFRVSLSSSTQSNLFPKVYHPAPQQKGTDSSLLSENTQSSQLFAETSSSLELCVVPTGNLFSPQQSQHSISDPERLLSENQLLHPLSSVPARPQQPAKALEPVLSTISPVPNHGSAYSRSLSGLKYGDDPVFVSSASDHLKSFHSLKDTRILSSHLSNVTNNPVKVDKDKELSADSGDEMSSDSLGLAPHEGDSSEADTETDLQIDELEQESEPLLVMQRQIAGSGSARFCDVDTFLPLGLDTDTGHSGSLEYTHCDRFHACQFTVSDSDPTVSDSCSRLSLGSCSEEHLVVKDSYTQSTGFQIHSARREEMSVNEPGTSVSGSYLSVKPTPSNSPRRNSRLLSASSSHCLPPPPSPSLPVCLSHLPPGSGNSPAFRPSSRAAQEIMEICSVDRTGCEDPDMDTDTAEHMLQSLQQELSLTANAQWTCGQGSVMDLENSGIHNQHEELLLIRGGVSEEQNEEEEAAERDRQSVLLLP